MKKIEAIIRPEMLEPLRLRLEEIGYPGMTTTKVEGHGKQGGVSHQWRGGTYRTTFIAKVKVEIVVADAQADKVVEGILEVCSAGQVGDGKIFVSPVSDAIRVSSKEKGEKALQ